MRTRVVSLLLLLLPTCAQPGGSGVERVSAPDPAQADVIARGLTPLARFIGEWQGTSESLSGNYYLARRVTWWVRNLWIAEQTVIYDPRTREEQQRFATLYTYDPEQGMIRAEHYGGFDLGEVAWVRKMPGEDGFEILTEARGDPEAMVMTSRLGREFWESQIFERDEEGMWQEVERLNLRRMHPKSSETSDL